jgi:hypothetical protein
VSITQVVKAMKVPFVQNHRFKTTVENPLRSLMDEDVSREPFNLWQDEFIVENFRDLILKMANFNPEGRITAQGGIRTCMVYGRLNRFLRGCSQMALARKCSSP